MIQTSRNADILARVLNSTDYFRGKTRLADLFGRLTSIWNQDRGTFALPDGKTVTIDLGDRIQRLMWGGAYESHVRKWLMALLRPGDTFVDIGAHIGFFSLIASSLVGCTGKVYAFEADSTAFRKLQVNAAEYPWLVVSWRAVSNRSGPAFFSNPRQPGETGWGKLASVRNEGNVVSVEAVSLDDWHQSVGCPPIRAVKIDAEGSEPFILEGAQHVIASTRPMLIVELNGPLLREVGRSSEEVVAALLDAGYRIFALDRKGLGERSNFSDILSPEVLCLPSELLEQSKGDLQRIGLKLDLFTGSGG